MKEPLRKKSEVSLGETVLFLETGDSGSLCTREEGYVIHAHVELEASVRHRGGALALALVDRVLEV